MNQNKHNLTYFRIVDLMTYDFDKHLCSMIIVISTKINQQSQSETFTNYEQMIWFNFNVNRCQAIGLCRFLLKNNIDY